jgi:microcystin-dependent protein
MTSYFTGGNSTFVGMSRFNNSPKVLTSNEIVAENLHVKNIGGGPDDGGGGGGNGVVNIRNLNVLIELIANNVTIQNLIANNVTIQNLIANNVTIQQDLIVNNLNLIPPGSIFTFATNTAPNGYLICNGSNLQILSYQKLYDAIGFIYNNAPPAGTFNIPDLRGYFVRGFDSTGVIDPGRVFGSTQIDQFASHSHPYQSTNRQTIGDTDNVAGGNLPVTDYATNNYSTSAVGGPETRPKNIAMLICIKT